MSNGTPRVVYLGPEFTFSHEAALKLFPEAELSFLTTFKDIFSIVQQGGMDYGVLPVENSSSGSIPETYQLLLGQQYEPGGAGEVKVQIVGEIILPIRHNLLSASQLGIDDIVTLYTHGQPLLQCADYVSRSLPRAEIVTTLSTADAAELVQRDPSGACIGSELLANHRALYHIQDGIQDLNRNVTRFFAISAINRPEKCNRTTFAIIIPDKPGMLVDALQAISENSLDISNIKTLPISDPGLMRQDFRDWFVLDVKSGDKTQRFRRVVRKIDQRPEVFLGVKFLGCYNAFDPRALQRIFESPTAPRESDDKLRNLIAEGESTLVEFKSTLRYDLRENRPNKELSKVIAKTVAAFMNSSGGSLFIGVGDGRESLGIDRDIGILSKKDLDGFQSALFQIVIDFIGTEFSQYVKPAFLEYEGNTVCAVRVARSTKPAWVSDSSGALFYVRAGNSSRPLDSRQALEYVMERFKAV